MPSEASLANLRPAWPPGKSAYAGQRPRGYRRLLHESRKLSPEALETIVTCMRDLEAPWAQRLRACEVILDRAWGAHEEKEGDALDRIASITLRIVSAENPDLARTVTIEREPDDTPRTITVATVPAGSAD